jgi:MarR family 2-MHQ and catechol resistance regulon transcriptional repressor
MPSAAASKEAVFCENVTFSQFFILDVVAKKQTMKLSELHKFLSANKSTTTRLVDPLVKQGFVLREKSNRDSRAVNLKLTREGESVHHKVWAYLSGFVDAVEMRIPEERRADVYNAVRLFLNATRDACAAGMCPGFHLPSNGLIVGGVSRHAGVWAA